MKFKQVDFNEYQENNIEYCGHVIATAGELEEIFGSIKTNKLRGIYSEISWDIKFEDGTVACIYDWDPERRRASEIIQTSWNIAGLSPHKETALYYVRHTINSEKYDKDSIRMIFK